MGRRVLNSQGAVAGTLSITGNTIATTETNADLVLNPNGTGDVTTADQVRVTNSTASTNATSGALIITGGMGVAGDLYLGGALNGGTLDNLTIGSVTPAAGTFSSLTVNGLATFSEFAEVVATKTGATGVITHDFTESNIWYHSSMSANFTMNLTNVPTTDNRTITVALVLIQGGTARYASAFQIDGVSQTIRWAAYNSPSPQANRYEIQTFKLVRSGGSWTVFGSLASYG